MVDTVPEAIDQIAENSCPDHAFLRAGWFRAAGTMQSLLISRGDLPLAALPLVPAGPARIGAKAVAGPYWPFRMGPIVADATSDELAAGLASRAAKAALSPVWRLGPFYADDPAGSRWLAAARAAGWTVLTRQLGHSFLIDAAALRQGGPWPRPGSLKKAKIFERQLGAVSYQRVTGADWTSRVFDDLALIEQQSWVAQDTDGSGAKFVNPRNRAFWEKAVRDPALAAMFSALILRREGRPVAFCFDLNAGACQYALAASFDRGFADASPGRLVTWRGIEWALTRGITRFDWGAGDNGYKARFGAVQGPAIVDCLIARNPMVAGLLRSKWQRKPATEGDDARGLPIGTREALLIASIATAAAVGAMAE